MALTGIDPFHLGLDKGIPQRHNHLHRGFIAVCRVLRQRANQHGIHSSGDVRDHRRRRRQRRGQMIAQDGEGRAAFKGHFASDQFVQHNAKRVQVRTGVQFAQPFALFRGHIRRRPDEQAPAQAAVARFDSARQPEIHQVRRAGFIQHDIRRFDVPVQDIPGMGIIQRSGDLRRNRHNIAQFQRPLIQRVRQRNAGDIFHHQIGLAFVFGEIIYRHDVRMF